MGRRIKFNAKQGGGYVPLPEGTYDLELLDVEQTTSKNDNPQLKVSATVADGPSAGKKVTIWYSLVPQAGWKLRNLLDALLVEYDAEEDEDGGDAIEFDPEDLVGRVASFSVTQREYNGRVNNDFGDAEVSKLDPHYEEVVEELAKSDDAPKKKAAPKEAPKNAGGIRRRRPRS